MSESFNFTLTVAEVNLVLTGLDELPAKHSLPIIEKLRAQYAAQQPAPEASND